MNNQPKLSIDEQIEFAHLYQNMKPWKKLQTNCLFTKFVWIHLFSEPTPENFKLAVTSTSMLVIGYFLEVYGAALAWALFAGLLLITVMRIIEHLMDA